MTAFRISALSAAALALGMAAADAAPNGYSPYYAPYAGTPFNAPPQSRTSRPPAPAQAAPVQHASPSQLITNQVTGLRNYVAKNEGRIDPAKALAFIEGQIAKDIDFPTMTRMALGRAGQSLNDQQRAAAEKELRGNFAGKLVDVLGDIQSTRIQVGDTQNGNRQDEAVVPVRVDRWNRQPLDLVFYFRSSRDGWKMYDAEANGQSAVLFYRGYFMRQMRGG
ncbi:MAG: ABC transporter substrate-binding protein [Alphaproteobacteria bacterium]|nr:ABC transporter substrate-binding protein [Alphaproteobacteria bacterium]MBF0251230.1 ABC transporter substrate-binding protein [Alphaproteobacteria bacterium]